MSSIIIFSLLFARTMACILRGRALYAENLPKTKRPFGFGSRHANNLFVGFYFYTSSFYGFIITRKKDNELEKSCGKRMYASRARFYFLFFRGYCIFRPCLVFVEHARCTNFRKAYAAAAAAAASFTVN